MPNDFAHHLMQYPTWIRVWIVWMGVVNLASVVFLRRLEARWVLAAMVSNVIFMHALFVLNGFNRLLGLSHVIFWTPLVIYLARRIPKLEPASAYGFWLRALLITNGLSLVIDYSDVVRYLLGNRS